MTEDERLDLTIQGDIVLDDGEVIRDGWLGVKDETIVAISRQPLRARVHHEARGRLLLPGFVDAHVHTRSSMEEGLAAVVGRQ